jgi:HSP20 family protein
MSPREPNKSTDQKSNPIKSSNPALYTDIDDGRALRSQISIPEIIWKLHKEDWTMKGNHLIQESDVISIERLQRQLARLLDTMWRKIGTQHEAVSGRAHLPEADLSESDKLLEITVDLPGVEEKDIEVLVSANSVTVQGEKKVAREKKGRNYYVTERAYGNFRRSFGLPSDADGDKTKATFENGVLTVTVPRKPGSGKSHKSILVTSKSKPKPEPKSKMK